MNFNLYSKSILYSKFIFLKPVIILSILSLLFFLSLSPSLSLSLTLPSSPPAHAATYTYDELGRLTSAIYDSGQKMVYSYDAAGNLLEVATLFSFYQDADGDDFGDSNKSLQAESRPNGYAENKNDCDDTDAAIHPGATEVCDGKDNDCDGQIPANEEDADSDGYRICRNDCNDADNTIHPGIQEICDGIDNNCDGVIDEGVKNTYYRDADKDGYGNANETIEVCTVPAGYVENSDDCSDADFNIKPGAVEVYDGIDNNCDSNIDEGCTATLSGLVYNRSTGKPIAKVSVAIKGGTSTLTLQMGDYHLADIPLGVHEIINFTGKGFKVNNLSNIYFTPERILNVNLALQPNNNPKVAVFSGSCPISGYIYDQARGTPLKGVKVQIKSYQGSSNTKGFYELRNILAGIYDLKFVKPGYKPVTLKNILFLENNPLKLDIGMSRLK